MTASPDVVSAAVAQVGLPQRRRKSRISLRLRIRILERDRYRCVYCGQTARQTLLEIDHIVPEVYGGTNDETNLVTACSRCNNGKAAEFVLSPLEKRNEGPCGDNLHPAVVRLVPVGRAFAPTCPSCSFVVGPVLVPWPS